MDCFVPAMRALRRGKTSGLLRFAVSAALLLLIGVYAGNIRGTRDALSALSAEVPVEVEVVSPDGAQNTGLQIDEAWVERLLDAGLRDPKYRAEIAANIEPINQVDPVQTCDTTVIGANSLSAFSFANDAAVSYLDGWTADFLSGTDAVCAVSEVYAAQHGIALGDTVRMPCYEIHYDRDGVSFEFRNLREVELCVVAEFSEIGSGETVQVIAPIGWARALFADCGVSFAYSAFSAVLADPMALNAFQDAAAQIGFREVTPATPNGRLGNALLVYDSIFRASADPLIGSLQLLNALFLPFFALDLFVLLLVWFLILRSARRELAVARSLGMSGVHAGAAVFVSNFILLVLSAAAISVPEIWFLSLPVPTVLLLNIVCLLVLMAGCALMLRMLFHFDVLTLLSKTD